MIITTSSMSGRRGAVLTWLGVVGSLGLAIIALHRLGADPTFAVEWGRLWMWLAETSPELVLLGLGRSLALVLAYWIAATALLYTAGRSMHLPALVRSVEWATLPAVRRLSERVVAVTLTVSTLTAGGVPAAGASEAPRPEPAGGGPAVVLETAIPEPPYVPVPAGAGDFVGAAAVQDQNGDEGYVPSPAGESPAEQHVTPPPFVLTGATHETAVAPRPDAIGPDLRRSPAANAIAATSADYVVHTGDHLWSIAERHLGVVLGRTPNDAEVATYWSHVIDVNRGRLRSGDPDLIFPGEVVECPAPANMGLR